jgi:hypothetical protein
MKEAKGLWQVKSAGKSFASIGFSPQMDTDGTDGDRYDFQKRDALVGCGRNGQFSNPIFRSTKSQGICTLGR